MKTLRLILGDQLSRSISSLTDCVTETDIILMCEVTEETGYVKHHKKKIAFLFSAMRHFASELKQTGHQVDYVKLDDELNSGSFKNEVARALIRHSIEKVIVTHPGEYRVLEDILQWQNEFEIPVEIRPDSRFLSTPEEFERWAEGRKQLRMEYFYRQMRLKYNVLVEDGQPSGGQWNFDAENRKPPKRDLCVPKPLTTTTDKITQDVLQLVKHRFSHHFGDLEPFYFAVTRNQALSVLNQFIEQRLNHFGEYQDAMLENEPWMYHSHISFYLNCGLLLPLECIEAAETAYRQGAAPLSAAEGFIRQILGWREYIRGIYWLRMPDYANANFFSATRDLPDFYWTADTGMNCIKQCVTETKRNAYAHHIQRLMVLGNFALIAGIDPKQVNEWFLIVYADAYEWAELPNVSGMVLFADGGVVASKPYAAGGNYISKMSDYCDNCRYQVTGKNGPRACPFNYLYWDFLARNRRRLQTNPRIAMMFRTYDLMSEEKKQAISDDAVSFLKLIR